MATPDPRAWKASDRISWRGVTLDRRTAAMLEVAEARYGVKIDPTQGSYSTSVGASAGTHDGGGAVDLSVYGLSTRKIRRLVRALRDVGFAAWHRPYRAGVWPAHVHAIAIGCRDLAPLAASQAKGFLLPEGPRDGLGAWPFGRDPMTYRPSPAVVFDFGAWKRREVLAWRIAGVERELARLDRQRARLVERRTYLKAALASAPKP